MGTGFQNISQKTGLFTLLNNLW